MVFKKAFPKTLKEARKEKSLSAKELAARCGLSERQIFSFESGKHQPRSETFFKIIEALGISTDEFMSRMQKEDQNHMPNPPESRS